MDTHLPLNSVSETIPVVVPFLVFTVFDFSTAFPIIALLRARSFFFFFFFFFPPVVTVMETPLLFLSILCWTFPYYQYEEVCRAVDRVWPLLK